MVVPKRFCVALRADGQPCQSAPQTESPFCWMHDPANVEAATEARRVGGLRRRREGTVTGAYEVIGLADVGQVRRLLEIAIVDALGLDNSIARVRTLAYLAQVALKMLEVAELEQRLEILEEAHAGRFAVVPPVSEPP